MRRAPTAHGIPYMPSPFLLVTGGKGGVGKSTLAANLAIELSRSGLRTLLVDLDLGLANLDVLLKLSKRHDVEDFFAEEADLNECIIEGPGGIFVLPAGSGTPEMGDADEGRRAVLLDGIARVAGSFDVVLGDTAAGIGGDVLAFAACADRVLVVTTPEPAALTDAYGVIKALDAYAGSRTGIEIPTPELVVNFADAGEAQRVATGLRKVCERFLARSPRLAGWLPRSRTILTAALEQRPFVLAEPRSQATQALRRLASRLAGPGAGIRPLKASDCHVR